MNKCLLHNRKNLIRFFYSTAPFFSTVWQRVAHLAGADLTAVETRGGFVPLDFKNFPMAQ